MPNQNTHKTIKAGNSLPAIVEYIRNNPGTSLAEACVVFDVSYSASYRLIKQMPEYRDLISYKNNGKQKRVALDKEKRIKIPDDDKESVAALYHNHNLHLHEIGARYGATAATVLTYFRKHNISTRTKREASNLVHSRNPHLREVHRQNVYKGITGYPRNAKRESWCERKVREFLENNSISFEQEFQILGHGHSYDFRVGNLLIEVDGVYWHSKPEQRAKDLIFEEIALQNNFRLIRITDKQLKRDEDILKDILCH